MMNFTYTKCMQTMKTWSHDIFQSDGPIWESGISSWPLESQDHFYDNVMNDLMQKCNYDFWVLKIVILVIFQN